METTLRDEQKGGTRSMAHCLVGARAVMTALARALLLFALPLAQAEGLAAFSVVQGGEVVVGTGGHLRVGTYGGETSTSTSESSVDSPPPPPLEPPPLPPSEPPSAQNGMGGQYFPLAGGTQTSNAQAACESYCGEACETDTCCGSSKGYFCRNRPDGYRESVTCGNSYIWSFYDLTSGNLGNDCEWGACALIPDGPVSDGNWKLADSSCALATFG